MHPKLPNFKCASSAPLPCKIEENNTVYINHDMPWMYTHVYDFTDKVYIFAESKMILGAPIRMMLDSPAYTQGYAAQELGYRSLAA